MPEGRGSLASIGSDVVLECRGVGFRGVAGVQCFVAEIPLKKFSRMMQRSKTKVWGAHSSPGVVHGGLAGHKARIALMR